MLVQTAWGKEIEVQVIQAQAERSCEFCEHPIPAGGEAVRTSGGLAHVHCKVRRLSLLTSAALAAKIGLTAAQFLRLAKKLGLRPEAYYPNPHYRSAPEVPLWAPELVDELAEHPELTASKTRSQGMRAARQHKTAARLDNLTARYPHWQNALLPAAQAMFSLNRYAKWESCSPAHRREVYTLKNELVQLLYRQGCAVEVYRHTIKREKELCWDCGGDGCGRCNFSGYYHPRRKTLVYIAFWFQIEDQYFSWHQPERLVNWPVQFTAESARWEHDPENEKPIELKSTQFADVKALVRYVLDRAKENTGNLEESG